MYPAVNVSPDEEGAVTALLREFNAYPVFLPPDVEHAYYSVSAYELNVAMPTMLITPSRFSMPAHTHARRAIARGSFGHCFTI
jgi:hypothetical protein